jgi:hypothetical protein
MKIGAAYSNSRDLIVQGRGGFWMYLSKARTLASRTSSEMMNFFQPSLTRRGSDLWLFPALKGWAKFTPSLCDEDRQELNSQMLASVCLGYPLL